MKRSGLIRKLEIGPRLCVAALLAAVVFNCSASVSAQSSRRPAPGARDSKTLLSQAELLIAEGDRMRLQWKRKSLLAAVKKYADALALLHRAGDALREADVLRRLGDTQAIVSEYQVAIAHYDRALKLTESSAEQLRADILVETGKTLLETVNLPKAALYCERARELSSRLLYKPALAGALNCLGVVNALGGEVLTARDQFEQALSISKAAKLESEAALAHLNLGYHHSNLGNLNLSVSSFKEALQIFRQTKNGLRQAFTLTAMAGVYTQQGEKQTAFDFHNEALRLFRMVGNRNGEAAALNGIGYWYDDLGNRAQALKCYGQALQLFESLKNQHYAAITLGYVARVHFALGDKPKALQFFKQKLLTSRVVQDRRMESYTQRDIGNVLNSMNQSDKALEYYDQALALSREVLDRRGTAYILLSIGAIHEQRGDTQGALNRYHEALSLIEAVADRRGQVQALYSTATAKRNLGQLAEARRDIERSLEIIEYLRTKIISPSLRISYLETVYKHYEFYVGLLMEMHRLDPAAGYDILALEVNDHGRARTLLENLRLAHTDIRHGVDPALLMQERELRQRLNQTAEQQSRLLSTKASSESKAAITREVEDLLIQYREVESQLRERSPKYAALMQPRRLKLADIQKELDAETLVLEYSLGNERGFGWAITKNSVITFELPSRAEIETEAKALRKAFTEPGTPVDTSRLSRTLLDPVAKLLPGKHLVIVPDGVLQYIPFAVLREPGAATPLLVNHEITMLPSISTIAVLRREFRERQIAGKAVAVLADPVFQKDDPRVRYRVPNTPARFAASASNEAVEVKRQNPRAPEFTEPGNDSLTFARLPFSLQEARSILRLASDQQTKQAVGFDASVQTALQPELRDYRVIHFATHAVLNNSYPELSGIVLSLVDETGRPQDGFLRLNEIYNMSLPVELVVLSACQTALGKEARGEGLIGLTRGFMYAGAPRVIASLWRVNDRAAAEFMAHFYEALFSQRQPPGKALRIAQMKMWRSEQWRSPQHWAAFILQGEWR